jgi:hypothetical protein
MFSAKWKTPLLMLVRGKVRIERIQGRGREDPGGHGAGHRAPIHPRLFGAQEIRRRGVAAAGVDDVAVARDAE